MGSHGTPRAPDGPVGSPPLQRYQKTPPKSYQKAPPKTSKTSQASYDWDANVIRVSKGDYDRDGTKDTLYYIDDDNSGIWETILIEIANKDELVVIFDYDEDGNWNEKVINTNSNPKPDFHIYDEDGDGEADYFGYDDNDDWVVDRYEEA